MLVSMKKIVGIFRLTMFKIFRTLYFDPQSYFTLFHAVTLLFQCSLAIFRIERTEFIRIFFLIAAINIGSRADLVVYL